MNTEILSSTSSSASSSTNDSAYEINPGYNPGYDQVIISSSSSSEASSDSSHESVEPAPEPVLAPEPVPEPVLAPEPEPALVEQEPEAVQGSSIWKNITRITYLLYIIDIFSIVWFFTHEARSNDSLFGYATALSIALVLESVYQMWVYLGKNHYPRLLAGLTRRRLKLAFKILNILLEFGLAVYIWAQLEAISDLGVGSVTRSLLEFVFYFNIVMYSLYLLIVILLIFFFLCIYRPIMANQRAEAGAVAADKEVVKEKTYVEKISEMAKEFLDASPSCIICMEDYELQDEIRKLGCGHFYHHACIDTWLERSRICPYCRQPIADAHDLRNQNV